MVVLGGLSVLHERGTPVFVSGRNKRSFLRIFQGLLKGPAQTQPRWMAAAVVLTSGTRESSFIDNLLVRIHLIIVMISVDRPCAMGV